MKKILTALAGLGLTFTLAACADETSAGPEASPTEVTTSAAPSGPVEVSLGETITLTNDVAGPRTAHLTIDEISVSEECHHGFNGHTNPTEDSGYYIQLTGSMESVEGERGYALSETWMTGTTADGYAVEFTPAFPCERPSSVMDGYQSFDSHVHPGQKARGVLEFWTSDLPETIMLMEPYEPHDYIWEVPQDVQEGAPQPEPASPAAPETTAPAPSAQGIWTEPGVGYRCAATDAWTHDPANCIAANLGGDPSYDVTWGPSAAIPAGQELQDLSNVPVADGGTCPAAICGYGTNSQGQSNPTSGELQTLHGCQEGYITDLQLCESVAWVETHQY